MSAPKDITECRKFFLEPDGPKQRMYEALRAYFVEDRPSAEAAKAFGYTPGSFRVLCHQFRRDPAPDFFVKPAHGPRSQPKKSAAREGSPSATRTERSRTSSSTPPPSRWRTFPASVRKACTSLDFHGPGLS